MSDQVYSVPGQTEERRKAFLKWKGIDLSHEISLTCGGNVNCYKSVHQPIPTHENREHPGSFQNEPVYKFCFQLSSAILLSKMKSLFFSL